MEDKVNHNLRVGDVFLEPDGWCRVCLSVGLINTNNGFFAYAKNTTFTADVCETRPIKELKPKPTWQYLFNMCDVVRDATKAAVNEDTDT